jgi:DNA polymerase alpha subunit B
MFEKISERSEALDTMIDEFAVGFQEGYGIGELSDPGLISEVRRCLFQRYGKM